jgi:hypothetical protein
MQIDYHTTSELWLSLEAFYNRGVTPAEVKAIIERMPDPGSSSLTLRCHPSGFNDNWIVGTRSNDRATHRAIVDRIRVELELLLWRRSNAPAS